MGAKDKKILEEIQPAVEKVGEYLRERFQKAYRIHREGGCTKLSRERAERYLKGLPDGLVGLINQFGFPQPIYFKDFQNLTETELENKRLKRAYFLHKVAGEVNKINIGNRSYLEELSRSLVGNPVFMFPDTPVASEIQAFIDIGKKVSGYSLGIINN